MEAANYLLCAVTALVCGALLLRSYRRRRVALLLWCGLAFLTLTAENAVLFVDIVILPDTDLSVVRNTIALVAVMLLVYGLVWESE